MSEALERTKTIELIEPITFNGRQYTSLTLRPPKTGERRQAEGNLRSNQSIEAWTKMSIQIVAKCADVPEAVIENLFDDQFGEAWEYVSNFLAGALRTTKAS